MADGLYDDYVESCMGAGAHSFSDLNTDTIKGAIASGSDYAENLTTDQDYTDTGYTANVCYNSEATQTLTSPTIGTVAARTFDAGDITFTGVSQDASKIVDAVLIYKDNAGTAATSPLIAFWDTGISVTPNSGDIIVQWNASGLFKW